VPQQGLVVLLELLPICFELRQNRFSRQFLSDNPFQYIVRLTVGREKFQEHATTDIVSISSQNKIKQTETDNSGCLYPQQKR
jgi:hypothetical protein